MSLTSDHFSHLFLGVWSPSAWSMRVCLHALRMSTTFTELIFQVFISGLVCWLEVDWGSLSRLRFKYQPAWKGKLLVWSRSVRAVYIVQPLENSGHSDRGSKVRAWNRASQAKKEKKAKKRRSPCITDAHPCHAASPPFFLGSKTITRCTTVKTNFRFSPVSIMSTRMEKVQLSMNGGARTQPLSPFGVSQPIE